MKMYAVFLVVCCVAVIDAAVPSYIHLCQKTDPKLGDCIKKSIYELLPLLKVGIPELKIPAIEPLKIRNVRLNTGSDAAKIDANLTDIHIWDASNFNILEIKPNVDKNTFKFKVIVPKVRLEGKYEINSKVLFLDLVGTGPLHINVTDYYFDCTLKGHKVAKENEEHLHFEKMRCSIQIGKANIFLENLFNGDKTIGQATNDVINDNIDAFFQEIKPNLLEALTSTFTDISNKITDQFNYRELFP